METIDALLEQLRALDAKPDVPVSIMYDIGMPMIATGYSQEMILNALFYLEGKKMIELLPGNRLRVLRRCDGEHAYGEYADREHDRYDR